MYKIDYDESQKGITVHLKVLPGAEIIACAKIGTQKTNPETSLVEIPMRVELGIEPSLVHDLSESDLIEYISIATTQAIKETLYAKATGRVKSKND